MKVNIRKIQI